MRIAHCMINIIFLYVESESLHEDSSSLYVESVIT